MVPGTLISRPRLMALLNQSHQFPLTLVSAPAGFGKTTLLATWAQSLSTKHLQLCWLSLDKEDNDPHLFWTYVLSALDKQQPCSFTSLLMELQSTQGMPSRDLLAALINLLSESTEHFVLILDDYQVITQEQVHTTLLYLLEHLPPQLRVVLSTRVDPPLSLSKLRARHRLQEIRTEQLCCTAEETKTFFEEVMHIHLPHETIQEVMVRTEGWLVGLQLLGLSLPGYADPATLLQEISGDQRYILDYLTEEVLRRQPQEVQLFLLCTCMLEQLTASLCNAVTQQTGSQHFLELLEQDNLFVTSLDSKQEWYRYHALFAEALYHQLKQTYADLLPLLHSRASLWYAEHDQLPEAILHAFKARDWQRAADLIEHIPLMSLNSWGASEHKLTMLQDWLERLPAAIMGSRPRLCLACTQALWAVAPPSLLNVWFDIAQTMLTASLTPQTCEETSPTMLTPQARQEQENLLGEVIAHRATLCSYQGDGESALTLCQQALTLLSAENFVFRAEVSLAQLWASYHSSANDAMAAIQSWRTGSSLAQRTRQPAFIIGMVSVTPPHLLGIGRLHEAQQLIQQTMPLGTKSEGQVLPEVGILVAFQAVILHEWNQLDTALNLAEEAIKLLQQCSSISLHDHLLQGYAVLLHILLSRRDYDAARSALQQVEYISLHMNQPTSLFFCSFFTIVDRVRLWLACGELDRATRWARELDLKERPGAPFAHEREEVARVRILLAKQQPVLALQCLGPVLQRARAGQRWGHVIEMLILQALAHQMGQEEAQALDALFEAIRLAEPEGYIRSFVDEGASMAMLLSRLRKRESKHGPTPYLDRLLAAFPQQIRAQEHQPKRAGERTKMQPLLDPLSERELEVLQLLAQGISNQEVAQELVITVYTVKRHVSHIFSKLGVSNRVQALRQARALGLFDENPDISGYV